MSLAIRFTCYRNLPYSHKSSHNPSSRASIDIKVRTKWNCICCEGCCPLVDMEKRTTAVPANQRPGCVHGAHLDGLSAAIRVLIPDSGNLDLAHPPTPAEDCPITSHYLLPPGGLQGGGEEVEEVDFGQPARQKHRENTRRSISVC